MIGVVNETELHEALKAHYRGPGGLSEQEVDGFIVDVLLPEEVVEIQTRGVGKLRRKLAALSIAHHVRLVHPIAAVKHIEHVDADGTVVSARRSPKRGRLEHAFREIASIADLLPNAAITVEIAMVEVTEVRHNDGLGSWRRKGVSIVGRRLDGILSQHEFHTSGDYLGLLPAHLPGQFTNREFGELVGLPYSVVQPITNTLRKMALIRIAAKQGNSILYERV